jgi:hypothetical protein
LSSKRSNHERINHYNPYTYKVNSS